MKHMGLVMRLFLLLLAALLPVSSFAVDELPWHACTQLILAARSQIVTGGKKRLPPELDWREDAFRLSREIFLDGKKIIPGMLSKLPPGKYNFLINSLGEGFINKQVPDENADPLIKDSQLFNTHRGLTAFMEMNGQDTHVHAAGEFEIAEVMDIWGRRSKVVKEVSNMSNTYWGGFQHLEYAIAILESLGLPITAQTTRIDFGDSINQEILAEQKRKAHPKRQREALEFLLTRNTPAYKFLFEVQMQAARFFPGKVAGACDREALTDTTFDFATHPETKDDVETINALGFLGSVLQLIDQDGLPFTAASEFLKGKTDRLPTLIRALEKAYQFKARQRR